MLGQALLTKRMGKTRVIAETGAGQHGVATATAAALLGLECVIYMGEDDTVRQALNVARMRLLGATVVPVTIGSRTLKDAINEAFRDWVANLETTHYLFGTVAGPHPFPAMVRDFQRIIGVEARQQCLDLTGALPDAVTACVGGGSNAIGIFHRFFDDPTVALVRVRGRRGRHRDRQARRRPSPPVRPGSCTGPGRTCCRTRTARPSSRTRSRPASTTPASGPSTRGSPTSAGRSTARSPTPRRWTPSRCSAAPRASSRPSSRPTPSPARSSLGRELGPDATILVNLSGRGDKDVDTAARWFGLTSAEEVAAAELINADHDFEDQS